MPLDTALFGNKLIRIREQLQTPASQVSAATGIPLEVLTALENGTRQPTGDEVLVLADFYKYDYRFFISNERLTAHEQTEAMFRAHGTAFSQGDRWAVQEFLYLCDCEEWALEQLGQRDKVSFTPRIEGDYHKRHGIQAADDLRRTLGYQPYEAPKDVYRDFRRLGCHVFRRQLGNSSISGLCVKHPVAGDCVLVNYNEDVYRQRFTVAHEAAHALLDGKDFHDFVVTFDRWSPKDLSEIRAHTFASRYLVPPEFLDRLPNPHVWSTERILDAARRLQVNPSTLAYALRDSHKISGEDAAIYARMKIPQAQKSDAELSDSLSPATLERRKHLLSLGLSHHYVSLCLDAYEAGLVTSGRLAEMMLTSNDEVAAIAGIFGRRLLDG